MKMESMATLSAVLVARAMRPTSSGSAVISVSNGSTENVLKSRLPVPSTSSTISAHPAAGASAPPNSNLSLSLSNFLSLD